MSTRVRRPPPREWGPPNITAAYRGHPNHRRADLIRDRSTLLDILCRSVYRGGDVHELVDELGIARDNTIEAVDALRQDVSIPDWARASPEALRVPGGPLPPRARISTQYRGLIRDLDANLRHYIRVFNRERARLSDRSSGRVKHLGPRSDVGLMAGLDHLMEAYEVVAVPESPNCLWVDVGPVTLEGQDWGCWWVGLAPGCRTKACLDEPRYGPYSWRHLPHPHVRSGTVCLGDASNPVSSAVAGHDLLSWVRLVANVLSNYGRDNPYAPLERWLSGAPLCGACGLERTATWVRNCHRCGAQSCSSCAPSMEICVACRTRLCLPCITYCARCAASYCYECAQDYFLSDGPDPFACWSCLQPPARPRRAALRPTEAAPNERGPLVGPLPPPPAATNTVIRAEGPLTGRLQPLMQQIAETISRGPFLQRPARGMTTYGIDFAQEDEGAHNYGA